MRKSLFLTLCLALAVAFAGAAGAKTVLVTLTTQQVANVCGKGLQSGGGHVGCTKKCGEYQCDYDCTKSGCQGQCITCPGQGRILPGLKSKRVVKNAVRAAR